MTSGSAMSGRGARALKSSLLQRLALAISVLVESAPTRRKTLRVMRRPPHEGEVSVALIRK
jgi:hypothetical protein